MKGSVASFQRLALLVVLLVLGCNRTRPTPAPVAVPPPAPVVSQVAPPPAPEPVPSPASTKAAPEPPPAEEKPAPESTRPKGQEQFTPASALPPPPPAPPVKPTSERLPPMATPAHPEPHPLIPESAHQAPAPPRAEVAPAPALGGALPGAAQGVVRRGLDRLNAQNQLHQIGIFYAVYQAEMGRPPARLEEFLAYIQREAPHEHQSLESGYFVLNLHSRPTSATALAYEKEPSPDGSRLVLMGDCNAVQVLDARGFAEAQKAGEP